eukprot:GHVQ01011318.1.p1 GENE.GHVQ01011318.1~~GHVQ01011318.1.p1  ORF type:complete len:870 (+),score=110.24 GHVQ01011318.1:300-2909(+)
MQSSQMGHRLFNEMASKQLMKSCTLSEVCVGWCKLDSRCVSSALVLYPPQLKTKTCLELYVSLDETALYPTPGAGVEDSANAYRKQLGVNYTRTTVRPPASAREKARWRQVQHGSSGSAGRLLKSHAGGTYSSMFAAENCLRFSMNGTGMQGLLTCCCARFMSTKSKKKTQKKSLQDVATSNPFKAFRQGTIGYERGREYVQLIKKHFRAQKTATREQQQVKAKHIEAAKKQHLLALLHTKAAHKKTIRRSRLPSVDPPLRVSAIKSALHLLDATQTSTPSTVDCVTPFSSDIFCDITDAHVSVSSSASEASFNQQLLVLGQPTEGACVSALPVRGRWGLMPGDELTGLLFRGTEVSRRYCEVVGGNPGGRVIEDKSGSAKKTESAGRDRCLIFVTSYASWNPVCLAFNKLRDTVFTTQLFQPHSSSQGLSSSSSPETDSHVRRHERSSELSSDCLFSLLRYEDSRHTDQFPKLFERVCCVQVDVELNPGLVDKLSIKSAPTIQCRYRGKLVNEIINPGVRQLTEFVKECLSMLSPPLHKNDDTLLGALTRLNTSVEDRNVAHVESLRTTAVRESCRHNVVCSIYSSEYPPCEEFHNAATKRHALCAVIQLGDAEDVTKTVLDAALIVARLEAAVDDPLCNGQRIRDLLQQAATTAYDYVNSQQHYGTASRANVILFDEPQLSLENVLQELQRLDNDCSEFPLLHDSLLSRSSATPKSTSPETVSSIHMKHSSPEVTNNEDYLRRVPRSLVWLPANHRSEDASFEAERLSSWRNDNNLYLPSGVLEPGYAADEYVFLRDLSSHNECGMEYEVVADERLRDEMWVRFDDTPKFRVAMTGEKRIHVERLRLWLRKGRLHRIASAKYFRCVL